MMNNLLKTGSNSCLTVNVLGESSHDEMSGQRNSSSSRLFGRWAESGRQGSDRARSAHQDRKHQSPKDPQTSKRRCKEMFVIFNVLKIVKNNLSGSYLILSLLSCHLACLLKLAKPNSLCISNIGYVIYWLILSVRLCTKLILLR